MAAIHSVDYNAATCYAYFYERDADSTVTVHYKRLKEEKVHFASIVRSLDGYFEGKILVSVVLFHVVCCRIDSEFSHCN